MRTVYDKSGEAACGGAAMHGGRCVRVPNAGREAHVYIEHILRNYDALAERTVFMHARTPSCGFFLRAAEEKGERLLKGGHLLEDGTVPSRHRTRRLSPLGRRCFSSAAALLLCCCFF